MGMVEELMKICGFILELIKEQIEFVFINLRNFVAHLIDLNKLETASQGQSG